VFTLRSTTAAAWTLPRHDWLWASVLASGAVVLAAVYLPAGHAALATVAQGPAALAVALVLPVLPAVAVEVAKAAMRISGRRR
jgi:hypothetical protein